MCTPALLEGTAAVVAPVSPTAAIAISPAGRKLVKRATTAPTPPEIKLPEQQQLPATTPPPTTAAASAGIRSRISDEQRRRLGLKGRRSTILTGAAGLTEPPTTRPKTLLGI